MSEKQLLISVDHSSFRVLLYLWSSAIQEVDPLDISPPAVEPASCPGPGGWSHLPFVPIRLPIRNSQLEPPRLDFRLRKSEVLRSCRVGFQRWLPPCVNHVEALVIFHFWALLTRFCRTKSHVYIILSSIYASYVWRKPTRAELRAQN